uniref:Uncharacterized protein n=1 Tax=Anguilla anguilla TaxID=7936 RepID=A0A0E9X2R2_ANGAN
MAHALCVYSMAYQKGLSWTIVSQINKASEWIMVHLCRDFEYVKYDYCLFGIVGGMQESQKKG